MGQALLAIVKGCTSCPAVQQFQRPRCSGACTRTHIDDDKYDDCNGKDHDAVLHHNQNDNFDIVLSHDDDCNDNDGTNDDSNDGGDVDNNDNDDNDDTNDNVLIIMMIMMMIYMILTIMLSTIIMRIIIIM